MYAVDYLMNMISLLKPLMSAAILTAGFLLSVPDANANGWVQSYKAGYTDANGRYCGGSEIMHLVPHKGRLYAFNGYWKDRNFGKRSAQVLRLDSSDGRWQVDLDTSREGLGYKGGNIRHMKGNILKSVTFNTDRNGKPVAVNLLVAASWAWDCNAKRDHCISVFVRNDKNGKWSHSILFEGPAQMPVPDDKPRRVRRVPRDIEVYHDPITKVDRIFLLGGGTGIFAGAYDASSKTIEWGRDPEYPKGGELLSTRPLGIAEANGNLYFSAGGSLFERVNGRKPDWKPAFEMKGRINPELGGFRGLTRIANPIGPGDSLIYVWIPLGRTPGNIKRLDGPGMIEAHETDLRQHSNALLKGENVRVKDVLGGYNRFLPLKDPRTGQTVYLVGFQQRIQSSDPSLMHGEYYKGATYCVRWNEKKYTSHFINGKWSAGKPVLVAPRTYAQSPFPEEKGAVYFGGYDSNFFEATDRAWIFKADLETVLYGAR